MGIPDDTVHFLDMAFTDSRHMLPQGGGLETFITALSRFIILATAHAVATADLDVGALEIRNRFQGQGHILAVAHSASQGRRIEIEQVIHKSIDGVSRIRIEADFFFQDPH